MISSGLYTLLTFSWRRRSKEAYLLARLLQLLGRTNSEAAVLSDLQSSAEWKDFVCDTKNKREKTHMLVLDLDETLIHSSPERKDLCEPEFILYDEDQRQHYYVYKRPFLDLFLELISQFYEISMYTASFSSYSDPILQHIDPESNISNCFSSASLVETKLYGMQKDLEIVSKKHMPNRLIMVDNSPIACMANQENLFVINSFKANQPYDKDLLSLMLLLIAMSDLGDVRSVLHRRRMFGGT